MLKILAKIIVDLLILVEDKKDGMVSSKELLKILNEIQILLKSLIIDNKEVYMEIKNEEIVG